MMRGFAVDSNASSLRGQTVCLFPVEPKVSTNQSSTDSPGKTCLSLLRMALVAVKHLVDS